MDGYIYCFSKKSSTGLKIGSTNVSPQEVLIELNLDSDVHYVLELSKNVFHYKRKENLLELLLKGYEKNGFYEIDVKNVEILFEMFDDVTIVNKLLKEEDFKRIQSQIKKRKKLLDYFENGQEVRHVIEKNGLNHEWTAVYNREYDGLYYNNCILTLRQFVSSHCESLGKKTPSAIWRSCEYLKDNHWLSFHLKEAL
jgi:hypothetical protein